MNEPEDKGAARPQVIDLDAEEIRTDAENPPPPETGREAERDAEAAFRPAPADTPRKKSSAGWIVAALILGLLAGGWLYRSVLASYFPSNQMLALRERVDALETSGSGLASQLAGLKQAADSAAGAAQSAAGVAESASSEAAGATQQAATASDGIASLGARLDKTDQRIAAAETALKSATSDLGALRNSLSSAPSASTQEAGGVTGQGTDPAALQALAQRIDALEKDVASLKSAAANATGGDTASVTSTLSQALSDLKAKVAAGTAYAAEYDRVGRMVPAAAGLDTVAGFAAEGLPNAQGLAAELRAAIPALPRPAAQPAEDDSYLGSLMKSLSGVITIRDIGETDWPAVAEKAAAFAEAGDLNQAVSVIDAAEGEKPMALTQWRDRAAARLQLEAALDQVSEAVLRQITALGGAQQ